MPHAYKLLLLSGMSALLALNLTACASKPQTPPVASPTLQLPMPPSVSTPLPSTDYSISANETIKRWRGTLKGTRMMSEPSSPPGQ